jgi:D-alanyl-lipoteichoic acid acyltransferase DltB (MBOAT superfamily)
MLFNTIQFVYFLPIVVILYYLIPQKYRWVLLLAASYYFYMSWKVEYIVLIVASTLIDYFSGIQMEKKATKKGRLPYLVLSLVSNLGLLFTFKYYNFFSASLNLAFQKFNILYDISFIDVLLPVGISFYTFQTLSYSIDVYYGRQKAEKHLGYFALYVAYFPQLVAGPIERFSRLAPQFRENHVFTYANLANGLRLILYGLFIKMVIADNLAGLIDQVYLAPEKYHSLDILTAVLLYSFQIYSDFYGYSIIAIGSALIMGVKIMDNFKTPYLAKNIAEFWQRWHISLSTWFRDYLYYPMGGNRVDKSRWVFNIFVVFVVSGLWHGANWTFLIWGALYGIVYLIENFVNKKLGLNGEHKPYSATHLLLAFKTFVFVSLIWVFFRSQSFDEAINIFRLMLTNTAVDSIDFAIPLVTLVMLFVFIASDILLYNKRFDTWVGKMNMPLRWAVYGVLIFSVIVFSGVDNFPFIYFQF